MVDACLKESIYGVRDEDILAEAGDQAILQAKVISKSGGKFYPCFLFQNEDKDTNDVAHVLYFSFQEEELKNLPVVGFPGDWDALYLEWKRECQEEMFLFRYGKLIDQYKKDIVVLTQDFYMKTTKEELAISYLKEKGISEEDALAIIQRIIK